MQPVGGARAARARASSRRSFFLDTKEQPYLTPEGQPFDLMRVWGHGGKTNVWGRVSLRYSDLDFKGRPSATAGRSPGRSATTDIAPYYDKVEQLIGVCGGDDDSDVAAGQQVPPCRRPRRAAASGCCRRRCGKHAASRSCAGRRANMTRPHRGFPRLPLLRQLRRAAATPRRSSARPITCCPSPSKTGQARDPLERRGRRACWWTTTACAKGVQYFDRKTGRRAAGAGARSW